MPKSRRQPVETITYKINPAAVWSDGVPITCADFQYTADQQQNGNDIYDPTGYTDIDKVTCPDPKTAVVTYKPGKTFAGWQRCSRATTASSRRTSCKGKDRDEVMKDGYTWSGGPWFAKWNKGDSIVLTPNPKYWGTKPHLDKVVFKFQADTAAEFQAFKSGQVDAIYPQPQIDVVDAIRAGSARREHRVQRRDRQRSRRCGSTTPSSRSTRSAVRQAIGYSIDRDAIVKKLFGELGVDQAVQLAQPARHRRTTATQKRSPTTSSNLDKVNELMTGDGWTKGADGIWAKDGKKAAFTINSDGGQQAP